jgi:hypothetical protein
VPNNDSKTVEIVEIKDLKQTLEIKTGHCDMNICGKWVKFLAQVLGKSYWYACTARQP